MSKEMTDEQVGKILRLADEVSEYDKALEFIRLSHTKDEATRYIQELETKISDNGKK